MSVHIGMTHWHKNGCLEIRARLTPEQGALVIKAIEAAVESTAQSEPTEKSESHALELAKDASAGAFPINNNHHKLLHEGQFSVVRQADNMLMLRRPDGTPIQRAAERNGEQTGSQTCSQIKLTHEQPWSARGDEMDYAVALYSLACANREQHGSHSYD